MSHRKDIITAGILLSLGGVLLVDETLGVRESSRYSHQWSAGKVSGIRSQIETEEVPVVVDNLASTANAEIRSLLNALETVTDSEDRAGMIEREIGRCKNPGGWLAALSGVGLRQASPISHEVFLALLRRRAEQDPQAVADFLSRLPEGWARREGCEQLAIAWANSDPQQAVSWAAGIREEVTRQTAVLALARETIRDAPLTSVELAGLLPPSQERDECLSQAIRQWAAADHASALSWAIEEADPGLKQQLASGAALAIAEASPELAAAIVSQYIDAGEAQNRAAVAVLERWGQTDPEGAARWLERFPDLQERAVAAESLAIVRATAGATGAWDWLTGLPDEVMRETARRGYATALPDHEGRGR